jgi:hypothetical protein
MEVTCIFVTPDGGLTYINAPVSSRDETLAAVEPLVPAGSRILMIRTIP